MNTTLHPTDTPNVDEAVKQLKEAAAAKKCWRCGCLHSSLRAIEEAYPKSARPEQLASIVELSRSRLSEVQYDCLGCEVCWPALAIDALGVEGDACPSEAGEAREGWPPLPGAYKVLRYHAPVAVCTLTDESLSRTVVPAAGVETAIVGTMQTENIGIERLMQNTLANPNIRFVVLCGMDSRQAIGHLPGQSLLALSRSGVDERMRIIGAQGKRPILRNVGREAVEHFRRTVEIVDMIGETSVSQILDAARDCAAKNPGPAQPFAGTRSVATIAGYIPQRMISDPAGYFVVFPDCGRRLLMLEHYRNDGVLDMVIEGHSPAELYIPAIEKKFISRLDHAAYLGRDPTARNAAWRRLRRTHRSTSDSTNNPHRNGRCAIEELARRTASREEAVCIKSCLRQGKLYSCQEAGFCVRETAARTARRYRARSYARGRKRGQTVDSDKSNPGRGIALPMSTVSPRPHLFRANRRGNEQATPVG